MTPRHQQAARLHATTEAKKDAAEKDAKAGGIRPGMSAWHVAIGQLVHQCAGDLAEHGNESRPALAGRIVEWVNSSAKDTRVFGNLPMARAQISSMTGAYLFKYAPGPEAQYLGSEILFDGGRIDLAWSIPGFGVVIDELKTTAWVRLGVDNTVLQQAQRYREFGVANWGDDFAGVRFLPLLNPNESRFIDADGTVHRLDESPAHALRAYAA